jgi:acylphosphatase
VVVKHLLVKGRVQGVGYRASMAYTARRYGVTGWVRNRRDGGVEAVAQGSEEAVQSFCEWARKGPDSADVASVDISDATGFFTSFDIRETI